MITPQEVIGVDVGGTSTRFAVVSEHGVREDSMIKYPTPGDPSEFLQGLGERLTYMAGTYQLDTAVLGIPGPVRWDGETPVAVGPLPNVAGFSDEEAFDMRAAIVEEVPEADRLTMPYFNDAHIAAQAAVRLLTPEGYKNEQPHGTILVSTGVGGEFLVDYRPIFSDRNIRGEYGHAGVGTPAVSMENLVSGTATANRHGRTTEELVDATDPVAEMIWKETGETLANGFGNLIAILDMDRLAFAGSVSAYGSHRFLPYFNRRMNEIAWAGRAINVTAPETDVVPKKMVDELALRGTIWAYQGLRAA